MPTNKSTKVEKKSKSGKTVRKVPVTKVVEATDAKVDTKVVEKTTKTTKAKKTVAKKTVAKKTTVQKGGAKNNTIRYFKIVCDDGNCRGRFSGKKPKQAANKALTSILREKKGLKGGGKLNFSICECTRGSKCKVYYYTGERKKLDSPMDVTIGDKKITYRFQNVVQKAKKVPVKSA